MLLFCLTALFSTSSPVVSAASGAQTTAVLRGSGFSIWLSPLGSPLPLLHRYIQPPHPYAAGHRGIDLESHPGDNVLAPVGGIVTFVGDVVDRKLLTLQVHENMLVTLEPMDSQLVMGEVVAPGESLGTVSTGGHCLNTCLHLGVRIDEEYVNPLRFFSGKAKLLPVGTL